MDLVPGKTVYVNHFSGRNAIASSVIDMCDHCVKVNLSPMLKNIKFGENDPIVLSYQIDKNVVTCEGYIKSISKQDSYLEVSINNQQFITNQRVCERFPVSLYSLIKMQKGKKIVGLIKNLSLSGMCLTTNVNLLPKNQYAIDMYIDDRLINVLSSVIWKRKVGKKYEYGLENNYPDYIEKNTVRLYLSILKEEQEKFANIEIEEEGSKIH